MFETTTTVRCRYCQGEGTDCVECQGTGFITRNKTNSERIDQIERWLEEKFGGL